MLMIRLCRSVLASALFTGAVLAQFPSAPSNPGASCSWVYPPYILDELCNETVVEFGPITITTLSCFKLWWGYVQWDEKVCTEICEPGEPGATYCIPVPIGFPPIFVPSYITLGGTPSCYKTECETVSTFGDVLAVEHCTSVQFGFGELSLFNAPMSLSRAVGNHVTLVHDVPNATAATLDGQPLQQGQIVHLCEIALGSHQYVVELNDGTRAATFTANLQVEQSYPMQQVDGDPAAHIVPAATFAFTNQSPNPVDLHLEATSISESLAVQLLNNQVHVLPGQTIERTVTFTTLPGQAVPEGAPLLARIDAYSVTPDNPQLNSLLVSAGSCGQSAGSGEDLRLATEIGDAGAGNACAKLAFGGDELTVAVDSPAATFVGAPTIVYYDMFTIGDVVVPALPGIPGLQLSAGAQVLLPSSLLTSAGIALTAPLPTALAGSVFRVQATSLSAAAQNGAMALSDAHDVAVY